MKLFIGIAACLVSSAAMAADIPLKAPPLSYLQRQQGWIWGIASEAGVSQTDVNSNQLFVGALASGKLTASGGTIGGTFGYIWNYGPTNWLSVEFSGRWENISGATVSPIVTQGMSQKWAADQVVKWGGFQTLLGYLPNLGISFPALSVPNLPLGANLAAANSHPYMLAGIREFGVDSNIGLTGGPLLASGHTVAFAPMLGMGVKNELLGADGKLNGAVMDVSAKVIFANKGITANFVPGGGFPTFGSAAKIGTTYLAGLDIQFGVPGR